MIELDPQLLTWLVLASAALSVALALAVLALGLRLRNLRREQRRAFDLASGEDVVGALGRLDTEVAAVRRDVGSVHANTEHLRELLRSTVSKVGVVRYDAFDDMGGALSFSAALLDERGCGVIVSAINGRTETRCYAKPVVGGLSEHHLSAEEQAAVDAAVEGRGASVVSSGRSRRRRSAS
ncbi:DUF4446 family protein [Egicoccus sp. AB-alg6-2]|uniref:DUF4446 family protein n=1 Tax=Egicoccus sp. AB-alg6-2 TaxID=3242692 RepID=UPI00359EBE26